MTNVWIYCLMFFFELKQEPFIFSFKLPYVTRSNYYGMCVEDAWAKGYTGEGVVIGIADVGVDTSLSYLKANINTELSFNFVRNNSDVTAEYFSEHPEISLAANHGNNVASIIGAVKDNGICSAGIAFRSTIAVLKIFEFSYTKTLEITPKHLIQSDYAARALVHRLHDIDILVMTLTLNIPFERLDSTTRKAFIQGVQLGRNGFGRIYVVSAGPIGNEITNNINTITVNGFGKHGTIPFRAYRDTSVLTSGLSDGKNLTSENMFTFTFNDDCTEGFSGVSAATSQVAAIIALAFQANPNLSARDIQHLIVWSSHVSGMKESYSFRRNGAGRFYHPYFGFGLLNATTLVEYARTMNTSSKPLRIELETLDECTSEEESTLRYSFCHNYNGRNDHLCITHVEYVVLVIDLKTSVNNLNIMVTSPLGTRSLFLENEKVLNGKVSGKLVSSNFWDELAFGKWKLKISSNDDLRANMAKVSMELHGTNRKQYYFKARGCRCNIKSTKWQRNHPSESTFLYLYISAIFLMFMIAGFFTAKSCFELVHEVQHEKKK